MDEIAVLGVLEAEQRAVRREGAPQEAIPVGASEAYRRVRAVDDLGLAAVERDVDREAVAIGDRRHHDPGRLRESLVPAVRHAVEERGVSPPWNGCTCQRPDSSPLSSWNHNTPSPSSAGTASTSPTGWIVTWRR